jgi:hypothetical protein
VLRGRVDLGVVVQDLVRGHGCGLRSLDSGETEQNKIYRDEVRVLEAHVVLSTVFSRLSPFDCLAAWHASPRIGFDAREHSRD